jgi:predicted oxidoreductase
METEQHRTLRRTLNREEGVEDSDRNGLVHDFNMLGERVATVDKSIDLLEKRLKQILAKRLSRPEPGEISDVIHKEVDVDTRAPLRQRLAEMTRQIEALDGRLAELMERVDL